MAITASKHPRATQKGHADLVPWLPVLAAPSFVFQNILCPSNFVLSRLLAYHSGVRRPDQRDKLLSKLVGRRLGRTVMVAIARDGRAVEVGPLRLLVVLPG